MNSIEYACLHVVIAAVQDNLENDREYHLSITQSRGTHDTQALVVSAAKAAGNSYSASYCTASRDHFAVSIM